MNCISQTALQRSTSAAGRFCQRRAPAGYGEAARQRVVLWCLPVTASVKWSYSVLSEMRKAAAAVLSLNTHSWLWFVSPWVCLKRASTELHLLLREEKNCVVLTPNPNTVSGNSIRFYVLGLYHFLPLLKGFSAHREGDLVYTLGEFGFLYDFQIPNISVMSFHEMLVCLLYSLNTLVS